MNLACAAALLTVRVLVAPEVCREQVHDNRRPTDCWEVVLSWTTKSQLSEEGSFFSVCQGGTALDAKLQRLGGSDSL